MYMHLPPKVQNTIAMSSEDHEKLQQLSPPPQRRRRHRHHYKQLLAFAHKTLTKPRVYITPLIVISLVVGCIHYISHLQLLLTRATEDLRWHKRFGAQCADPVTSAHVRQTIIDHVFHGTSPWENFPPAHVSPLLRRERTVGWGSNATVFERLIRHVRPRTIIEVGTFLGSSATHMAGLTRKLGLDTQILCIDDFRGWPGPDDEELSLKIVNGDSMLLYQFMQNVVRANATDSILFLPFSTMTALSGLCEWGVYGDLVEVDADHDFHAAWMDINNAYKVLRSGGVLFGHDYLWRGVSRAVHMFARLHGLRVGRDGEHWILY